MNVYVTWKEFNELLPKKDPNNKRRWNSDIENVVRVLGQEVAKKIGQGPVKLIPGNLIPAKRIEP